MLSDAQKLAVMIAIKKVYIVNGKTFTATVIYPNEINPAFPKIILHYIDELNSYQKTVGNYLGRPGYKGLRAVAHLSINIEVTKNFGQSVNLNQIVNNIASQLYTDIKQNWHSLASGTVKAGEISQIRNLTGVGSAIDTNVNSTSALLESARVQFDVPLMYSFEWAG